MKTRILPALFAVIVALGFENAKAFATSDQLVATQGFASVCAAGVSLYPKIPGYWQIYRPRLAVSNTAIFATMDALPTTDGEFVVSKVDAASPDNFSELARFKTEVRDVEFHDGKLWLLFRDRVVELDPITGAKISEFASSAQPILSDDYAAHAFTFVGDRLVIAHGAQGMVVHDLSTRAIVATDSLGLVANGKISKAIDVTPASSSEVLFAVEAVTHSDQPPFPFNGLVLKDLNAGAVQKFSYDRGTTGTLSTATIKVSDDNVIINNWGVLQTASLAEMKRSGTVRVKWTPVRFEVNGKVEPGELLGDMLLANGRVYSCAEVTYQNSETKKIVHQGLVYSDK